MSIDLRICLVRKPGKDPTGIQTHSPGAAEEGKIDHVNPAGWKRTTVSSSHFQIFCLVFTILSFTLS